MRKTNLLKGVVCGLLFTVVAGSAVFAGTYNNTENQRNEMYYSNTYNGTLGTYMAYGTKGASDPGSPNKAYANLKTQNTTGMPHMYTCSVYQYDEYKEEYDKSSVKTVVLSPGQNCVVSIPREYTNNYNEYYHHVSGYYYTNTTTVQLDDYSYTADQE